MSLEEDIDKETPPCYKNYEYSYVTIGGTLNSETMCYHAFKQGEDCKYSKIKNNKQYCTKNYEGM